MSGILGAYQLKFIIRNDPTFVSKDICLRLICLSANVFLMMILKENLEYKIDNKFISN